MIITFWNDSVLTVTFWNVSTVTVSFLTALLELFLLRPCLLRGCFFGRLFLVSVRTLYVWIISVVTKKKILLGLPCETVYVWVVDVVTVPNFSCNG